VRLFFFVFLSFRTFLSQINHIHTLYCTYNYNNPVKEE
jgi:hypothetical protein